MVALGTTQLSSKGQVVIPEAIRVRLGLNPGCRFVVVASKGTVILKVVEAPDPAAFSALLAEARRSARKAGLRQRDVAESVRRVRGKR
ncbi:MAG: AbrB/MazE/SpoVT family DNA-binding domain-containing protein [Phycisphaerae bacterium]|nr:AbrB/MazE/SpoVT family DNA-binding domain-containing protein [Phycisphaerae bacterium]